MKKFDGKMSELAIDDLDQVAGGMSIRTGPVKGPLFPPTTGPTFPYPTKPPVVIV